MTSFIFLALVFVVFVILNICDKHIKYTDKYIKVSKIILLISSYMFVIYANICFAAVLALLTIIVWYCGNNTKNLQWGVAISLLFLVFFKYTNFFLNSFAELFGFDYSYLKIIMPLGISFYTFSAIGYLLDIQNKKITAKGICDVALYLSFFPKFTSGPIQDSEDFFNQIDKGVKADINGFAKGIQIFMFGLFKKLVLADRLSVFVDQVYSTPDAFGSLTVFMASIAYSLQIYYDFSGYSDMAIGTARILGIKLPRNFNIPYLSRNVTELWKRWHITLSTWLIKYLYIPLGGNRKGHIRTYINLILTMLLSGLWHGANYTYIIWGLLHGLALAVHKVWMKITRSSEKEENIIINSISVITTFLFTSFCWIFFRAESVDKAFNIIKRIFSFENGIEHPYIWLFFALAVMIVSSLCAYIKSKDNKTVSKKKNVCHTDGFYPVLDLTKFWNMVAFFVLCGLILGLAYTGGSPFIYGKY